MSIGKGQVVELPRVGDVKVGKMLGSGGFGEVYLVNKLGRRGSVTKKVFALKVIQCDKKRAVSRAAKEALTLLKVKHENIVRLIDVGKKVRGRNSTFVFLLTEYCSGGDLNRRLKKRANPSQKLEWLYQIASAIAYLHSRRPTIVHRDLKPANVLLTKSDDIKVADFGLARQYEALTDSLYSYYMNSVVGTNAYVAPEVLSNHYTEKVDIFSLGILFYAILEEKYLLLPNKSRLYGAFVNGCPIGIAMYYSRNSSPQEELLFTASIETEYGSEEAERLKQIILDCLLYDPRMRPKAREIRNFIADIRIERDDECDFEDESDSDSGSEDDFDSP